MGVAGATAEIAFDGVGDLLARGPGIALEQLDASHDHAWRAITALQTVTFPEALLDWMELAILGKAFDGGDF